jgi:tetratricopeptide (TPR) repeat protein
MTFKGSDKRIPEIAQDLKVRYALEGSVRKAGNSLRITAQLIDAKHDVHLWADKYTGALEDVFDMQEKVSLAIVDALRVTLTADEVANLAERPLNDVSAFECYLRAKASSFEFSVEGVHRAIQHLDDGLRMIGANALLYSGLAFAYMQLVNIGSEHEESLAKAHQYVEQALALDPQCADAHATLAWIVMLEGDVVAMAKESKQALALDPTHTLALATLASAYIYAGRLAAAQPVCERLQQVDPIAFQTHWTLGALAFYGGEFDAAVQLWHALYDHYSSAAYAPFSYAIALYYSGEHDAAAAVFDENAVRHPGNAVTKVGLVLKHAAQRDTSGTHALMDPEFVKTCRRDYSFAHHVAGAFAVLGETEEALAWLETAIDGGFINYPMLVEYDPLLVSVRGDERFKKLMGRVKRKWEEFEV